MNIDLLTQAFLARLLPIFHEVVLNAIRNFHFEQYPMAALVAAFGALAASALLYLIGIWLRRWPERVSSIAQRERIERMRKNAQEWLPWLLVLTPTPAGAVIIIAAGFFAIRPRVAAACIISAEIVWRAMPYLNG